MNENIIASLIAGVLLGVITSTWKNYIFPFLIENFGERIKIHTLWYANLDFGSGNPHKVKLNIKKLGYEITGDLEFISGRHLGKNYIINGRFHSNILTFRYYPVDKHSTSQGSATLHRLKDGELLSGHFAYYSKGKNIIDTVKCEFFPVKN